MSRSKQIGKIAVLIKDQHLQALPLTHEKRLINNDGTYLITGGTSGFGLEIAKWLALKGVGELVLVSRRGATSHEAMQAIEYMKESGTQVMAAAVDITNYTQVKELFEKINADLPPLRGIFHCAMVLDDGFLFDLDKERFINVMAPKIEGALNLHRNTKRVPLDHFVLFSSISSIFGNIGQANYVAANAFLDTFAHYRRSQGLPAIAINWGVLAETGVVARNDNVGRLFQSAGIIGLNTEQALEALELVLEKNPVEICVFDADWARFIKSNPISTKSSKLQSLINAGTSGEIEIAADKKQALIKKLALLKQVERQHHIESVICEQISKTLKLPISKIGVHQSIDKLGIDSLIALELTIALESTYGITISTMDLLKQPSISILANQILNEQFSFK